MTRTEAETGARERDIIGAFVNLSNELAGGYDIIDMLITLTTQCADLLDIASAGLLLADPDGALHLVASSSERTRDLETFQIQRNEGPCLDAHRDGEIVVVPDLAAATTWPAFSRAAREGGFVSVHALPMKLRDQTIGAFGLFGTSAGRLSDDDLALAQALVHVAGVAIVNETAATDRATVNAQLQRALTSRIVLEQAKGVLAHTGSLEMSDAFTVLRRYARDHGRKLSEVAFDVANRHLDSATLLAHARSVSIVP